MARPFTRPIVREVVTAEGLYAAELSHAGITLRRKHTRRPLPTVAWSTVLYRAVDLLVAEREAARRARRTPRRRRTR